jgi:CRP/FNR family transcriptional regulator, cyclic AMP receptor protein
MSFAPSGLAQTANDICTEVPFTTWIGPEDLAVLHRFVSRRHVGKGEVLWREGGINDHLVLLLSGRVKLLKETAVQGRPIVLGLFGPGALLSDASFATGQCRFTSAAAVEDSQILSLSREDFESLAAEHPVLANRILSEALMSIADQLQHAYRRLAAIF